VGTKNMVSDPVAEEIRREAGFTDDEIQTEIIVAQCERRRARKSSCIRAEMGRAELWEPSGRMFETVLSGTSMPAAIAPGQSVVVKIGGVERGGSGICRCIQLK